MFLLSSRKTGGGRGILDDDETTTTTRHDTHVDQKLVTFLFHLAGYWFP